jgi:hypothetical protein
MVKNLSYLRSSLSSRKDAKNAKGGKTVPCFAVFAPLREPNP